jgi:hypothetical protein
MTDRSAPSAAGAIYPHLQSDKELARPQRAQSGLAAALYPSLVPQPPKPINPYREALLDALKDHNRKADARLAREGRR